MKSIELLLRQIVTPLEHGPINLNTVKGIMWNSQIFIIMSEKCV